MKIKSINRKLAVTLLMASMTGFIVTLGAAAIGSFLMAGEKVSESAESIIVALALLMGGLMSALFAVKRGQGSRLILSLAGAGGYFLLLLICGAVVFGGIRSGVGITVMMVLGSAFVVWVMGLKGNKNAKYRIPKL